MLAYNMEGMNGRRDRSAHGCCRRPAMTDTDSRDFLNDLRYLRDRRLRIANKNGPQPTMTVN